MGPWGTSSFRSDPDFLTSCLASPLSRVHAAVQRSPPEAAELYCPSPPLTMTQPLLWHQWPGRGGMNAAVQANRDVRDSMREPGCSLDCHRHIPLQSHLSLLADLSPDSIDLSGCGFHSPTQMPPRVSAFSVKHKAICLSRRTPPPSWVSFQLSQQPEVHIGRVRREIWH